MTYTCSAIDISQSQVCSPLCEVTHLFNPSTDPLLVELSLQEKLLQLLFLAWGFPNLLFFNFDHLWVGEQTPSD